MNIRPSSSVSAHPHHMSNTPHMHDATELALRCHQECSETFQYCLQRGGEHIDPHHLKIMQTCIEICLTSARFMMLQSPYHSITCELCAQICQECARSCEELNDSAMLACAEVCRQCSDSCAQMAMNKS